MALSIGGALSSTINHVIHKPLQVKGRDKARRIALDAIAERLGIKTQEDWFTITAQDVKSEKTGYDILKHFSGSLFKSLKTLYPEFEWNPIRFSVVPKHHWEFQKNQRQAMDWLAEQLEITQQEDWYHVRLDEIQKLGGDKLLSKYHYNSIISALKASYPEYEWNPSLMKFVNDEMSSTVSVRKIMDGVGEMLGVVVQSDWYEITWKDLKKFRGASHLAKLFNHSMLDLLSNTYPQYEWSPVMMKQVPLNFWKKLQNRREAMDWYASQLGIQRQEDWYDTSGVDVQSVGAEGMLNLHYNGSLSAALEDVYPEFEWNIQLFTHLPRNHWEDRNNHRKFLDMVAEELDIQTQEDWSGVTFKMFSELGGEGLLRRYYGNSLFRALKASYPEFEWNPSLFNTKSNKSA